MPDETMLKADVRPVRCNNPEHPKGCPLGYRLVDCDESEARWWLATVSVGQTCHWSQTFDSRTQASAALVERMSEGFSI